MRQPGNWKRKDERTEMGYLLGIDIGTTNVKAVLFDQEGRSFGRSNQPYPTSYPQPGWVHQEPEDWYCAVAGAIRQLLKKSKIKPEEILCAGFSGHIRTVAFLDQDFQTLYPGIVWSDTRSAQIAQELNREMKGLLVEITGNEAATNYALSQILWMRRNHPMIMEKTAHFATPKSYVLWCLTGNFVSDPSDQAGSLLLDIRSKRWSRELLEKLELREECLPRLKRSMDVAGFINRQTAKDTGLCENMPVIVGGGDNDCAAIGAGVYESGVVSASLGTAGIILSLLDRPITPERGKLDLFPHVIPEDWYIMGMVKTAGDAVKWLKERLAGEGLQENSLAMKEWTETLETEIGTYVPGSDGLICFPYYQGRGNPKKTSQAKGIFWGLTLAHTNHHFLQATMEGVSYCVRECIQAIEEISPVKEIVCCGGGSSSPLWMQITADILGKPVWVNQNSEEGALGAAILAAVGAGIYSDVAAACEKMTRHEKKYIPDLEKTKVYNQLFQQFCELSDQFW